MSDGRNGSFPGRREFISLGIGAFVVGAIPFAARNRSRLVRRSVPVMGTIAEIAVVHDDEAYAHKAIDAAVAELRWVDRTMTRFNDESDVGRANLAAVQEVVPVTTETALVLEESLKWAEVSGGRFDPCLAGAVVLWDVANRDAPPSDRDVRRYAGRGLYRALEVERRGPVAAVTLHQEEMGIDLGGVAKGYGVDRAVEALRSWGIRNALVNAGGDLYAMGSSEDNDPWKVGIRSPVDPSKLAGTIELQDRAVATSGDYEQYFEHRGRRYHHLLDPESGEPRASLVHSVTVAAESCMVADAGATTVFGTDAEEARRLLVRGSAGAELVHLT